MRLRRYEAFIKIIHSGTRLFMPLTVIFLQRNTVLSHRGGLMSLSYSMSLDCLQQNWTGPCITLICIMQQGSSGFLLSFHLACKLISPSLCSWRRVSCGHCFSVASQTVWPPLSFSHPTATFSFLFTPLPDCFLSPRPCTLIILSRFSFPVPAPSLLAQPHCTTDVLIEARSIRCEWTLTNSV